MTVFAVSKGGTSRNVTRDNTRMPFVSEQIINFGSALVPNSGYLSGSVPNAVTLSANAAADTANAINIPAGFVVLYAGFEVLTADTKGNSGTIQITDGTSTYTAAVTVQTTGIKAFTAPGTKLYTSAGILSALVGTGNINAVIRVFAVLQDVTGVDTAVYA
jgi:hypothetical protein